MRGSVSAHRPEGRSGAGRQRVRAPSGTVLVRMVLPRDYPCVTQLGQPSARLMCSPWPATRCQPDQPHPRQLVTGIIHSLADRRKLGYWMGLAPRARFFNP
jgi:hypothetical protein